MPERTAEDPLQKLIASRAARVAAGALIAAAVAGTMALAQPARPTEAFKILGLPLALGIGAGGSLLADLPRPKLRVGSALVMGAVVLIAVIVRAVFDPESVEPPVSYIGFPLAGALPFAVRAWMHAPPTSFARVERILEWAFAGAFWVSLTAVSVAFGIKNAGGGLPRAMVIAAGAAVVGAVYVHAMMVLDPDGAPPGEDAPPPGEE